MDLIQKSKKEWKRVGVIVAIAVASAFAARFVVRSGFSPPAPDPNLQAYYDLLCCGQCIKFSQMNAIAQAAEQEASDPDLRKAASMICEGCDLSIKAGVDDIIEAQSGSGMWKALVAGFTDLRLSFQSWGVIFDHWWHKDVFDRVDGRYGPLVASYFAQAERAQADGNWAFWIVGSIVVGCGLAIFLKTK